MDHFYSEQQWRLRCVKLRSSRNFQWGRQTAPGMPAATFVLIKVNKPLLNGWRCRKNFKSPPSSKFLTRTKFDTAQPPVLPFVEVIYIWDTCLYSMNRKYNKEKGIYSQLSQTRYLYIMHDLLWYTNDLHIPPWKKLRNKNHYSNYDIKPMSDLA